MKKMKSCLAGVLLGSLLFAAVGAAQAPQLKPDDYPVVDGSTATLPLSRQLMRAATGLLEQEAQERVLHSKTTESFYALINGQADLLLVYEPSSDAYEFARERGVALDQKSIGRDAPVFLINTDNPVKSLTEEQIVGIYAGEFTNWKQLGGQDLDIAAYQRIANSGSQVMVEKQVMRGTPMMEAPTEMRTDEMGELIDAVASYKDTPAAIGYSVYYYVHNMYIKENVQLLSVNGVMPTNETIASGEYPYGQDFYAVIRADEPKDSPARQLFDFLSTEEGKALIESAGYVPVQ